MNSQISFGKYKNKTMKEALKDESYISWVKKQDTSKDSTSPLALLQSCILTIEKTTE